MLLMAMTSAVAAEPAKWSNEARNPSRSLDRGFKVIYELVGKLEAPECARVSLAAKINAQEGYKPLFVSNKAIFSPETQYALPMDMTFRKDGVDYVSKVTPYVDEPFVAQVYSVTCDSQVTDAAYMPNCQNLALLDRREQEYDGGYGGGWGGFDDRSVRSASVPEPSTFALFLLGFLWFKRFLVDSPDKSAHTEHTRSKRRNQS